MKGAAMKLLLVPLLLIAGSIAGPLDHTVHAAGGAPVRSGGTGAHPTGGGAYSGHGGGYYGRSGGAYYGHGGGYYGHGGGYYGHGYYGHGYYGHGYGGSSFSLYLGGPWYPYYYPYGYPYGYPYPYPYYPAPSVVVEQPQPQEFIAPAPQAEQYWYYCKDSNAYYPYVKSCPGGWMKQVPNPTPPADRNR